jgi:hypothetical protein
MSQRGDEEEVLMLDTYSVEDAELSHVSIVRPGTSGHGDSQLTTGQSTTMPPPRICEYIRSYFAPTKKEMALKCLAKLGGKSCGREIKYSATSFNNLKAHYKSQHPLEAPDFMAALSAGSKRGRHSSGAR